MLLAKARRATVATMMVAIPTIAAGQESAVAGDEVGIAAERASAMTPTDTTTDTTAHRIPEVTVIGETRDALRRIPGAAALVDRSEIDAMVRLSGNEVFRAIPGIHVAEEEGAGLRANIGIRGLDPGRSRTVLILEDGVPVALAPYGEPEMYYTPPIDRMERVEVVKGSGSILFGPQTIGGVINYVTPSPPAAPGGQVDLRTGSGGFLHGEARYGGRWDNAGMTFGLLRKQADDFRGLFFEVTDLTGKVILGTGARSDLSLKVGLYDEISNSTYVGLTESMYAADPTRPNLAQDDRLRLRRYATSAAHELRLSPAVTLRTTAYGYTTTRNWQRQDYRYLNGGSDIEFLQSSGNRNRSFLVGGVEPRLEWNHALGELDAGFRLHHEQARDARIDGTTGTAQTGTIRDDEVRTGNAFSVFAQNRFFLGDRVQVVPGLRVEAFRYDRNILRTRVRRVDPETGTVTREPEDVDIRSGDSLFEVIPGIGLTWAATESVTVFAGAHRGFAPPRTKDALIYPDDTLSPGEQPGEIVSLQLDAERSWNFELGTRAAVAPGIDIEATAFLLDFTNQIIPASDWAGAVADAQLANQGETRHVGVEGALSADAGSWIGVPGRLWADVSHTWVHAAYTGDRDSGAGDRTVRGNRLPYAPEHTTVLQVGVRPASAWAVRLEGSFVGEQFADRHETVEPSTNGRVGLIAAYDTWNLATDLQLPGTRVTVFGTVRNLFDREYIASRRPEGIKPGLPRQLVIGARTRF